MRRGVAELGSPKGLGTAVRRGMQDLGSPKSRWGRRQPGEEEEVEVKGQVASSLASAGVTRSLSALIDGTSHANVGMLLTMQPAWFELSTAGSHRLSLACSP